MVFGSNNLRSVEVSWQTSLFLPPERHRFRPHSPKSTERKSSRKLEQHPNQSSPSYNWQWSSLSQDAAIHLCKNVPRIKKRAPAARLSSELKTRYLILLTRYFLLITNPELLRNFKNKKLLGDDLLSQAASSQVPSVLADLTSGFGMGPGVPPPL